MNNLFSHKDSSDCNLAKDPICGMRVDTATALKSERDGKTYYFCSPHCQKTFEAQPTE